MKWTLPILVGSAAILGMLYSPLLGKPEAIDPNTSMTPLKSRQLNIATCNAMLSTIPSNTAVFANSRLQHAAIILGDFRAAEGVPQLLRLICVKAKPQFSESPSGWGPPQFEYPAVGALVKIGMPSVIAIRDQIEKPNVKLKDEKIIELYGYVLRDVLGGDHVRAWLLEEKKHCPKGAEENYDVLLESKLLKNVTPKAHRRKAPDNAKRPTTRNN